MNALLLLSLVAIDYHPAFLGISTFGRPTALGTAYAAIAEDAAGVFYNPAGPNRDGLAFALTDWLVDTRIASGAGAYRINDLGTVAAGLNYLSYGDLARWDENGNLLGSFSSYSLYGKVAFAHTFADLLSAGLGVGYVAEAIDDWTAGSLTLDAGLKAQVAVFGAGIAIRDFTGAKNPFLKSFGVHARPVKFLLLAVEAEHLNQLTLKGGAELSLSSLVLRGGIKGSSAGDLTPSLGLGLKFRGMSLDYAAMIHSKLGLVHQLSLGVNR
jgi:hypothetical protein